MIELEVRGASKSFGPVRALEDASLALERGRVHAIVGENGAGKSTLLKIATGALAPDRGRVEVLGRPLAPRAGVRAGVGMVAQHFSLVGALTALENMMLGFEGGVLLNERAAARRAGQVLEELGVAIDLDAPVASLGVGDKQRLEIARVLFRDARVLLLDEPTAVLAPREADALYGALLRLARAGRAIAVVTHKLDEVYAYADDVTVMRRGRVVGQLRDPREKPRAAVIAELAREVMGSEPPAAAPSAHARARGDDVLVVEALVVSPRLRGATLRVRAGEIVGLCGVEGSGQDELVQAIAGLVTPSGGFVRAAKTSRAIVFPDRHKEGLVLGASVLDNLMLGELRGALWDTPALRREARERLARARVTPADLELPTGALSGGNQQKIVVERACSRGAELLVLSHPARGVDIGAARFIEARVAEEAARGAGVLVLDSDLDLLRRLCDRLLVMARGRVREAPKGASLEELGELMLGAA